MSHDPCIVAVTFYLSHVHKILTLAKFIYED